MSTPNGPSRLDSLRNLRARIDQEIEREQRYLERIKTLSGTAKAIVTSPRDYDGRVIAVAAAHFGIGPLDVTCGRRGRDESNARHVAAWLMRESGRSFPEIGRALGKDHTSVIYGVRRVEGDAELMGHAAVIRAALVGQEEVA